MQGILSGCLFVAINITMWLCIYAMQTIESRRGWIPKRHSISPSSAKPFPYFQDYRRGTWGDAIGLSIIYWAAGYEVAAFHHDILLIGLSVVLGLFATSLFLLAEILLNRINFAIPRLNHLSLTGYVHLVYFFLSASCVAFVLLLIISAKINPQLLIVTIIGSLVYLMSFGTDYWIGMH
jgi:hypothetical protein